MDHATAATVLTTSLKSLRPRADADANTSSNRCDILSLLLHEKKTKPEIIAAGY